MFENALSAPPVFNWIIFPRFSSQTCGSPPEMIPSFHPVMASTLLSFVAFFYSVSNVRGAESKSGTKDFFAGVRDGRKIIRVKYACKNFRCAIHEKDVKKSGSLFGRCFAKEFYPFARSYVGLTV